MISNCFMTIRLLIATVTTLLLLLAIPILCVESKSRRIRHYPLTNKRSRLDQRRSRNLQSDQIEIIEEDNLDGLYQGYGTHYVDLDVGCPKQRQTLIVDTGSSIMGFPCRDCIGCGDGYHLNPNFDEQQSSCFTKTDCEECESGWPSYQCFESNNNTGSGSCEVGVSYMEGSSWSGYEVEDMVALGGTPDEDQFRSRFACQTELTGLFKTQLADGILGMDKGQRSFWKQMVANGIMDAEQFSLCYSTEDDVMLPAGVMVLGGNDKRLHETPMVYAADTSDSSTGWFQVDIRKLYLRSADGGMSVVISNTTATTSGSSSTTTISEIPLFDTVSSPIVDSGTTITYLDRSLGQKVAEVWPQLTDVAFPSSDLVTISDDEYLTLPTFLFQLKGADSQIHPDSSSMVGSDIIVAFPPSRYIERDSFGRYRLALYFETSDSGILGANFIAGHDVHFDAEKGRIGFAESHCLIENVVNDDGSELLAQPNIERATDEPVLSPSDTEIVGVSIPKESEDNNGGSSPSSNGATITSSLSNIWWATIITVLCSRWVY